MRILFILLKLMIECKNVALFATNYNNIELFGPNLTPVCEQYVITNH
jgi:hypothetical protein